MSCPDCFKGSVHEHDTPKGTFRQLHGYNTYITGNEDSQNTILYIPDAFGVKLINNKLLADKYAAQTGCRVLVPDIIPGGGASISIMNHMETVMRPAGFNPISWFKKAINLVQLIFKFVPFFIKAGPPKVYPAILEYTRAIKESQGTGKLGVCGFCWGGYATTKLCTEKYEGKSLIDAAFTAHPSALKTPDMVVDAVAAKVPWSCAVAEKDILVNAKVSAQIEAVLRTKFGEPEANHYELVVYKGCGHGFAVRANPDNKPEKQGSEDAVAQAVNWFNRFLK